MPCRFSVDSIGKNLGDPIWCLFWSSLLCLFLYGRSHLEWTSVKWLTFKLQWLRAAGARFQLWIFHSFRNWKSKAQSNKANGTDTAMREAAIQPLEPFGFWLFDLSWVRLSIRRSTDAAPCKKALFIVHHCSKLVWEWQKFRELCLCVSSRSIPCNHRKIQDSGAKNDVSFSHAGLPCNLPKRWFVTNGLRSFKILFHKSAKSASF